MLLLIFQVAASLIDLKVLLAWHDGLHTHTHTSWMCQISKKPETSAADKQNIRPRLFFVVFLDEISFRCRKICV